MSNDHPINLAAFKPAMIRNFSIIAHIDHGKSTLADRLLEITGTLSNRKKNEQFLDKLQVEKERGITVKAQTASMLYDFQGTTHLLNLIDTPGHVDFTYEVSRSLYACQGAILLVDASQGVEAQTMANFYLAFQEGLTIIPVINKVDILSADPERCISQLSHLFDFKREDVILASAKTGLGITDILNAVIERIPAPAAYPEEPLKALLFDSWFDDYRGVICLIAVHSGAIKKGDTISMAQQGKMYEVAETGFMYPNEVATESLYAGQVGYVILGMKSVKEASIGDTLFNPKYPVLPFPGFKPAKPVVFASIFPIENSDFNILQDALGRLTLNDASVTIEKKSSPTLGLGFRCGFLGRLHMDVFKERLEQEYGLSVITTAPSVLYKVIIKHTGEELYIENPAEFPDAGKIEEIKEPMIEATIILPKKYLGPIMTLCHNKRGQQKSLEYVDEDRLIIKYRLPLNEVATEFYDKLKSLSSGYASFDYEESGYEAADLVKLDILLNGRLVDAFSAIVHTDNAYYIGRNLTQRLKQLIPRQQFEVAIQAAIGSKILARESISPMRKDVIAKCYGGDVTRKNKLLDKQKEGKKKMKQVGTVEVPQEAFHAILTKS